MQELYSKYEEIQEGLIFVIHKDLFRVVLMKMNIFWDFKIITISLNIAYLLS